MPVVRLMLNCVSRTLWSQRSVSMKLWLRMRSSRTFPRHLPLPSSVALTDRKFRAWKLIVFKVMLSMLAPRVRIAGSRIPRVRFAGLSGEVL